LNERTIGRVAREPDVVGFFAQVETYPEGDPLESEDGFETVDDAIAWTLERVDCALIRFGFSTQDEFAVGAVPHWSGKQWPPGDAERAEIESRVLAAAHREGPGQIEVVEPEVHYRSGDANQ
jgi:hypothetical protein